MKALAKIKKAKEMMEVVGKTRGTMLLRSNIHGIGIIVSI